MNKDLRLTALLLLILISMTTGQQVRINEIMAANASSVICPETAEYPDWIEVVNVGNTVINLMGYSLTDDLSQPAKWPITSNFVITPNQHFLFWADGLDYSRHTNFKLDRDGETLGLFSNDGTLIDSVSYGMQLTDVSYGRHIIETATWGYFSESTPESANTTQFYVGICPAPIVSETGGLYTGQVTITVLNSDDIPHIRYTLDGKEPNQASLQFSGTMPLSNTTTLRLRGFAPDLLPSPVITRSYLIDEDVHLPVISLVTDPDHLFSDQTGIYVIGTNGVSGYCSGVPMNLNRDWERPLNIEFFDLDGETLLNQGAGVQIFGGCSRTRYPQKSLALYARSEYGAGSFDCQFFPDKPITEFQSFILRSSADDQPFTMFRDGLAQSLIRDVLDVDVQAYRPVVVFINGAYWGIHNIREKLNEHYPAGNYDLDAGSIDVLRRNPYDSWNIVAGSSNHYNAMMDYVSANNLAQTNHFDYVGTQMEIDEYIDYQIAEMVLGTGDWPGNNIKFWRSQSPPHNRWRWITYDLDWTVMDYQVNTVDLATDPNCNCSWPNPPWSTLLFRRLLDNNSFRNEFIQCTALYMNTAFHPERIIHFTDSLQAAISPEIPRHIDRWGGQTFNNGETWMPPTFASMAQWETNVAEMHTFATERPPWHIAHMLNYFGLAGMTDVSINTGTGAGEVLIYDRSPHLLPFSGQFFQGIPLVLEAIPDPGYDFSHFEVTGMTSLPITLIESGSIWKYLVTGTPPDANWNSPAFSDDSWPSGAAQLGYGDGDEVTVLGYGPDPENKYPTTYFRKNFPVDNLNWSGLTLELLRDDGAVIYLNGSEVERSNMDQGPVDYYTYASDYVSQGDEDAFFPYWVDPELLVLGENLLAVEIHQANPGSSDISFDFRLFGLTQGGGETVEVTTAQMAVTPENQLMVIVYFEQQEMPAADVIVINEINYNSVPDFDVDDWVELVNTSAQTVNLQNWQLRDDRDDHQFVLPEGTTLGPSGMIVLCRDTSAFRLEFPDAGPIAGNFDFGLGGDGDQVRLFTPFGLLADSVAYSDTDPWPTAPDGSGATLELMNPQLDNGNPAHWLASFDCGTPGTANSVYENLLLGDVTGDLVVDVLDVVLLVSLILNPDEQLAIHLLSGDISPDGTLDILDLVLLVDMILGG